MKFKSLEQVKLEQKQAKIIAQQEILDANGLKHYDENADRTDFNAACQNFKEVCRRIGNVIGNDQFKGGFDEAISFVTGDFFQQNQTEATALFALWLGCDKACTYAAKKLGIGQPKWWKICWNMEE